MIRGMSYNRGIFFMNNEGIAHATSKNGKIITRYMPITLPGLLFFFTRILFTIPLYFLFVGIILFILIDRPSFINYIPYLRNLPPLPVYTLILFALSYHLLFPKELKRYHGAEHKVFSYTGRRHLVNAEAIALADIVNRYCSTNTVVYVFLFYLLCIPFFTGWLAIGISLMALVILPRIWKWGDQKLIFPISAYLQRNITTSQPEEKHLKVAILAYMSLQTMTALSEEDVWHSYEIEQEELRIAAENRQYIVDMEKIHRLLVDEEREQISIEVFRDTSYIEYINAFE